MNDPGIYDSRLLTGAQPFWWRTAEDSSCSYNAKRTPILLLDEATNALDAMSEKKAGIVLEELMRGKTRTIITNGRKTLSSGREIYLRKCNSAAQKNDSN